MKPDTLGLTKGQATGRWQDLDTVGDVKRFLRWAILSVRAGKLDNKTAGVLGQLGLYLLKAIATEKAQDERGDKAQLFLDFFQGLIEFLAARDPEVLRALQIHLRPFADHMKTVSLPPHAERLLIEEQRSLGPDTLRRIREEVYGLATKEE